MMSRKTVTDGLVPTTYEAFFSTVLLLPCGPRVILTWTRRLVSSSFLVEDLVVEQLRP